MSALVLSVGLGEQIGEDSAVQVGNPGSPERDVDVARGNRGADLSGEPEEIGQSPSVIELVTTGILSQIPFD
jgi:hypothetical protein